MKWDRWGRMLTHKTQRTQSDRHAHTQTHRGGHTQTHAHIQAQRALEGLVEKKFGGKDLRGHWGKEDKNIFYIWMCT